MRILPKLPRPESRYHAVFVAALLVGVALPFLFPTLWTTLLGFYHQDGPETYPFLDMHGRLAAFQAHREGIPILYQPNPYDPVLRINVKPTWPLGLSFLGLGPQHLILAGTATIVAFLSILASILRPRNWVDVILLLLLCLSPPVFLGIERANDDLVYFCLLALVPVILQTDWPLRHWLAWLVIFLLAPAKYYPGAVFTLFLLQIRDWRQLGVLLSGGLVFVTAYVTFNLEELLYLRGAVPTPDLFMVHGASLTFEILELGTLWSWLLLLALALVSAWILGQEKWYEPPANLPDQQWFLFGFSIFAFCFLLNSNFDYRFIFTLPMLPLLMKIGRENPGDPNWASLSRLILLLLVLAFWADIMAYHMSLVIREGPSDRLLFLVTAMKNVLVWFVFGGSTLIAVALLRPNLRHLAATFRAEFRSFRLR